MTEEEQKTLADRIAEADAARYRMKRLQDGIESIHSGQCIRISVAIGETTGSSISWMRAGREQYEPVCWASKEPGLETEIKQAVLDLLGKRLADATKKYEQA